MPEPTDLPEISDGDLGPIVKKICSGDLHGDRLIEPIGSSIGRATIGIYRVSGSAQPDSGKPEPWSAVLKIVDVDADPAGQLEFELSGSPEFLAIGNGLRPAVCYGTQDRGRSERWIWSEDLTDVSQPTWTDSVFLNVARDIGKFHANSIGKVPPGEWRRQGIYGSIMVSFGLAGSLERLPETASNALASPIFGETGVKAIAAVLQNYEAVANGLKHLTTVLVHNDCHVGNLYPIEKNGVHMETVAIDWATAGLGPLGEDAGNLIAVAVRRSQVDLDNFIDLERTTFDRYADGLLSVNTDADLDHARTGYLAGMGFWGLAKFILAANAAANLPAFKERVEREAGLPVQDVVERMGRVVDMTYPYALECVERLGL